MNTGMPTTNYATEPGTAPPWMRGAPQRGGVGNPGQPVGGGSDMSAPPSTGDAGPFTMGRTMLSAAPGAAPSAPSTSGAGGPMGSAVLPGQGGIGSAVSYGSQQAFGPNGPNITTSNVDPSNPNFASLNTDFSGDAQRAGDAFYKGATQYFEPDFARDTSALQTQLINQGFAPGSEGYNTQLDLLRRNQDQARTGAAAGAVSAGNQQAQNEFLQALQARQEQFGEAGNVADRAYNQSAGIAGLGLGARGQDIGLQGSMAGLAASRENAGASRYNADLQHQIQLQQLGLQANGQNFDQVMSLMGGARGGVNMPNFGNPQPLDVTGAGSLANQSTMLGNQATAARNAGLYGLGAAALSGLGSYFGSP